MRTILAAIKEELRRLRYLDARHYRTLNLPYRVRTRADFDEVEQEFTDSLNSYLCSHTDRPSSARPIEYKMVPKRGWVYEFNPDEIQELQRLLKEDLSHCIPSRAALNALRRALAEVEDLKGALEHYKVMAREGLEAVAPPAETK